VKVRKIQKKKAKPSVKRENVHYHEINGILLLALGLLMLISFYFKNSIGLFGIFIKDCTLGIFGFPAFLIPPSLIAFSLFLIIKKSDLRIRFSLFYSLLLFTLISALIHTMLYKPENYSNLSPLKCIAKFYLDGASMVGGGVIGGIVSVPFLLVFQKLGTIIILTALLLIDIILLTNSSLSAFIRNLNSLFSRNTKVRTPKIKAENNDEGPEIIDNGDDLSLQFKPKIIDFKIEKNARDLKEKTSKVKKQPIKEVFEINEEVEKEEEDDAIELMMQDIKPAPSKNTVKAAKIPSLDKKEAAKIQNSIDMQMHSHSNSEYKYPPVDLLKLDVDNGGNSKALRNQVIEGAKKLEDTLNSFGVSAKVINVTRGPTVTRYELQPSAGVKVSRIVNLADDISLNLAASGVRMEAPIPGKAAIGIEVPNKEVNMVLLREILESEEFCQHPSKLSFAIGKDISGECVVADIAKMPHLLIAGATGSGKSVCINSLIISLLYKATPEEVKLLMIDPKVVELGVYNGIPHLMIPVVTEPKKAAGALNWAVQEMVNRYKLFADKGVRDLKGYNEMASKNEEVQKLPQIVIIIDELADLMMVAPNDVEDAICRLAQMARAAGMHLVIATQRPSVDVITGVIKANIPSRISFAVSSQIDSRTILDMAGAEKLLGRGDMLFHPVGKPKPIRLQGANITDTEVEKVVEFVKSYGSAEYDDNMLEEINNSDSPVENDNGDNDELLPKAIELVVEAGQASVSLIQRKFKVGYARAARIVDQMEARGIVGGFEGSKPRQILISRQQWQELQMAGKE
jgi:DNA segregation ATPase FtsK/SpoIIIE and related proteins